MTKKRVSGSRRALATAGAVIPGVLVHGSGHLIAGEKRTGLRLLAMEGGGAALAIAALGGAAWSGAARRLMTPIVFTGVVGVSLFAVSFLADVYGLVAPEGGTGSPPATLPWVETQLGFAYVYERNFAFSTFVVPGIDLRYKRLRFSTQGWFALDDANSRLRAEAAYRFFGPGTPDAGQSKDGSFVEVEGAFTQHRYTSNGFSVTTGEVTIQGRLDLYHVGPTLRGSFADLGLGIAWEGRNYAGHTTDGNEILVPHFGFGVYIGHEGYPRGEARVYYEHRHDGFVAGTKSTGLGSGVIGHFGLQGRVYVSPRWGLLADAQGGSAYLGRLSVLFRHGGW